MSSPKKRIVIVALIFAALSMLAVWRPDSRSIRSLIDAGGPPSAELGHESSVRTLAVDPGRSDRAWPVGIQRTYAVDFAYSIDFPEKKDDAVGATLHGRGMLELVALEDGDRSILRGALVGATVDVASTSGKKNGLLEIMPIQLARPFAVQLDHDLRIERVYF
ncbi:MAG TPA: hypothetical protein VFG30_32225, partial [Polyangiales bacterium]|nr:hypothetical protein [Polyangiales bacterium]